MTAHTPVANLSAAASLPRHTRWWLHWQAKTLLTLGLNTRAMVIFRQILRTNPSDLLSLNSLAYDALRREQRAEAYALFTQVAALDVGSATTANAQFNVAFVAEELGQLEEAEQGFRAALALDDKLDRAWYGLGLVLIRQERLEEAVSAFKTNSKLQPMSPFAWYQLARVYVNLARPEEARTVIAHLKGFEPKVAAQLERETGLKAAE
jgi:tetratricopeptide (TPR) repeat protein